MSGGSRHVELRRHLGADRRRLPTGPRRSRASGSQPGREFDRRADALARHLLDAGLHRQSKVAAYLYNGPEYLETYFAAFKAGLAPVNTNYRYVADELIYLFDNADAEAVVFHAAFTPTVEQIRGRLPKVKPWIAVAEPGQPVPPFAADYEASSPRSDGRRCAALGPLGRRPADPLHRRHHRHAQGRDVAPGGSVLRARRGRQLPPWHAAVRAPRRRPSAAAAIAPAIRSSAADHDRRRAADARHRPVHRSIMASPPAARSPACPSHAASTPSSFWNEAARLKADARRDRRHGLRRSRCWRRWTPIPAAGTSRACAASAPRARCGAWRTSRACCATCPPAPSSTAWARRRRSAWAPRRRRAGARRADTAKFMVGPNSAVFTEDGRRVEPGSGERGHVAVSGFLPVGYYKDPEKTARTFRDVRGPALVGARRLRHRRGRRHLRCSAAARR